MTPKPHDRPDEGSDRTQKLALPREEELHPLQTLKLPHPAPETGEGRGPATSPGAGRPSSGSAWKLPLVFAGIILAGGTLYFVTSRGPAPSREAVAPAPETVPPGAQAYLDQARAGDAHAMRMLGVMYYYGLNVPQDRERGLQWYRKAAERGSEAARSELTKLEETGK